MKDYIYLGGSIAVLLVMAAFGQKDKPKEAPYDPDKLAPGEVACGRPSKRSAPCKCREIREKLVDDAQNTCRILHSNNKEKRIECIVNVNPCPAVIDHDNRWKDGEAMPIQCSRSCTKARCECCHS